ncbi:DUF6879 family protein [Dactylosporangium aurantiacum]|uniref:DUF6879 family protein n=1 Tax=Dactylosporangium aurantiacum TaxID=35754 RepID=UPI00316AE25E
METRNDYDASYEQDSFQRYLAGDPDDMPWMQSWLDLLRDAASHGRRFTRVRIVTVPLTDYSRFGVWCARLMNEAGEDIRYVTRDVAVAEELPTHDYWLFDSRKLVRMHFDDSNHFLGGEVIEDDAEIVQHNYWRDAAWHHAIERDDFAAQQGI